MITDEPIYSITSKITTTPISITRRFLFSCPRKARKNTKGRTVFFSIPFVFSVDLLFFIRVDPCLPSWFPIQERGSRQYQPIHELFVHGRHEKTRKGERCSFPCLSCFPWTFSSLFVSIRVCLRGSTQEGYGGLECRNQVLVAARITAGVSTRRAVAPPAGGS